MKPKGKLPFDPKMFLAKVGKGKTISKYRTDQIVFSQGESCERGLLHSARQGQAQCPFRARQGSGGRNLGTGSLFWRRMSEWSFAAHRNNEGGR